MSAEVIAKRYATAFVAAADTAKADIASLAEELSVWGDWLDSDVDGAQALLSPVLAPEKQAGFLKQLLEQSDAQHLVRGLLLVCLDKRRLAVVSAIVVALQDEISERSGSVSGQATTAHTLSDNLKQQIADKVGAILNKTTQLDWREDASLLGGFTVQVGHTVWNASLQHQLNRLEDTIRKGVM